MLRDPARSFRAGPSEIFVPPKLIKEFGLVDGTFLSGTVRKNKRGPEVASIDIIISVNRHPVATASDAGRELEQVESGHIAQILFHIDIDMFSFPHRDIFESFHF